jgi:antitoxin ParD1/3/4
MAALDASIGRGLADAEAGRTALASDVFDRLAVKYHAQMSKTVDSGSSPE